jgi:isoleucyl-tRNA synthetase
VAGARDSVHLCDYPVVDSTAIHRDVESAMAAVRTAVSVGRALRDKYKLKNRQPLALCTIVSHDTATRERLLQHADLLKEELNVKSVVVVNDDQGLATLSFKANFKTLGKKAGPKMKQVASAIEGFSRAQWDILEGGGSVDVEGLAILKEDVIVNRAANGDVVLGTEGDITVALDTTLNEALQQEALANELGTIGVEVRKERGFGVDAKFATLTLWSADAAVGNAATAFAAALCERLQVAAIEIADAALSGDDVSHRDADGAALTLRFDR